MTPETRRRELVPTHRSKGFIVGWRCSVCRKDFSIPLDRASDTFAPPEVSAEFEAHSCADVLIEEHRDPLAS